MNTDAAGPFGSEFSAELGPDERAKLDALLDHIYEYGTAAEGVLRLAADLCQSSRAVERERWREVTRDVQYSQMLRPPCQKGVIGRCRCIQCANERWMACDRA